ncbi:MAG: F420-0--gamma-glutamyl ligase, partial [Clostridia bacterium]|nr:F420-0--gamma-glutamyl ligase [Clostridia bacterium]
MERMVGTISRGIRAPIIREGDNLPDIVVRSVLQAAESEGFAFSDRDIVAVTEAVVARAQGNYAHIDDIARDVREKLGGETIGVIFPILSRNRFAICLRGIARGAKKVVLMVSYPADEVGNHLIDEDLLDEKGIDPCRDVLTEAEYRKLFGRVEHPFTGVDYLEYYAQLIRDNGAECEIILSNDAREILRYTDKVLTCDIHSRFRTKRRLLKAGAKLVLGLDDLMTAPVGTSGCNPDFGLLGSNKATEETVKLFPRNCDQFVAEVAALLHEKTGKHMELMVYG